MREHECILRMHSLLSPFRLYSLAHYRSQSLGGRTLPTSIDGKGIATKHANNKNANYSEKKHTHGRVKQDKNKSKSKNNNTNKSKTNNKKRTGTCTSVRTKRRVNVDIYITGRPSPWLLGR